MDKIHINIININNDQYNEIKYVKNIISNLEKPDDNLVVTASYKFFIDILLNSDLKFFSKKSKHLFLKHLHKIKIPKSESDNSTGFHRRLIP